MLFSDFANSINIDSNVLYELFSYEKKYHSQILVPDLSEYLLLTENKNINLDQHTIKVIKHALSTLTQEEIDNIKSAHKYIYSPFIYARKEYRKYIHNPTEFTGLVTALNHFTNTFTDFTTCCLQCLREYESGRLAQPYVPPKHNHIWIKIPIDSDIHTRDRIVFTAECDQYINEKQKCIKYSLKLSSPKIKILSKDEVYEWMNKIRNKDLVNNWYI